MPSPFPGMDPYLEDPSVWEEFHYLFNAECMYLLADRLPEHYVARVQERVELISISDGRGEICAGRGSCPRSAAKKG